jgi:hypothetical protein
MNALGTVTLVATAAAPLVVLSAAKGRAPMKPALKYAMPAALATPVGIAIAAKILAPMCLIAAMTPAVIARQRARKYATLTYPRAATERLLAGRLKPIVGDKWSARAMLVHYCSPADAGHGAITGVDIKIPRNTLPSKILDDCKKVLTETIGRQWSSSTSGTMITFKPKPERNDPPALRHLKAVLLDRIALGAEGTVEALKWGEEGSITEFVGRASRSMGNALANADKQAAITALVQTRIPLGAGSWDIQWDVTDVPAMHGRVSAFCDKILKPPIDHFVTSKQQAVETYPHATFNVGVHAHGETCTRVPIKEPNGITCGAPGKGKTNFMYGHVVEAAAWGFVVIIVDGKCASSYIGFRDWPCVQIVANDMYTIIRTIFYVDELLTRRQSGGRTGKLPVDDNVAVWFIVDEYADITTRMQTEMWEMFRSRDNDLPKKCEAIEVLERLPQMIREFRIHMDTGTQKPDAQRISPNIVASSDKRSQWGKMSGPQSQPFWDDYTTGPSVPPVAGRGVIKTEAGEPKPVQAYYVPDPLKAHTAEEYETLATLLPPKSLHRRIVFEMPDPATASWNDIKTAPWRFAEDRPDLDPLSPHYNPPEFMRYNTFGKLNAATLDIDELG